jgi:hypothetical protein
MAVVLRAFATKRLVATAPFLDAVFFFAAFAILLSADIASLSSHRLPGKGSFPPGSRLLLKVN